MINKKKIQKKFKGKFDDFTCYISESKMLLEMEFKLDNILYINLQFFINYLLF